MKTFSVIVPAYNVQGYVEKTLESLYLNCKDNMEAIIVDDGSTDNTYQIINNFIKEKNVDNFISVTQDNQGVSVARNVGIEKACGEYLIFCDGDDTLSPDMLKKVAEHITGEEDLLVWRYDILQNGKSQVSQVPFEEELLPGVDAFKKFLFGKYRIRLGSFAVKKALIDNCNLTYTVGCKLSQDVEFMFKMLARVNKVRFINDVLFTYVKHEGSVMYKYNMNRFEAPRVARRIYEYVKNNSSLLNDKEIKEYLYNGYYVLHSMYSFNSCIQYMDKEKIKEFWKEYLEKYPDVEENLKYSTKHMKIKPAIISKKQIWLFCLSRKLYTKINVWKKQHGKGNK